MMMRMTKYLSLDLFIKKKKKLDCIITNTLFAQSLLAHQDAGDTTQKENIFERPTATTSDELPPLIYDKEFEND